MISTIFSGSADPAVIVVAVVLLFGGSQLAESAQKLPASGEGVWLRPRRNRGAKAAVLAELATSFVSPPDE